MCFRSMISIFDRGHVGLNFENFPNKVHFLSIFYKIHVEYSRYRRSVKSTAIKNLIFHLVRYDKMGGFPIDSRHEKTDTNSLRSNLRKKFPNFSLVGDFLYWIVYMYCRSLSVKAKISRNSFFQKSTFATEDAESSIQR